MMTCRRSLAFSLLLICSLTAAAKNKKKIILPTDILEARTVLVVIDPDAGIALDAPNANRTAEDAVETALRNWGRFTLTNDVSSADLVISIRKGSGKMAQQTIGGIPNNRRPGVYQPADSGGTPDASRGTPTIAGDPTRPQAPDPHPQLEVGPTEDMFVVYRGKRDNALDRPAVWRYSAKDALRSPAVPAVDEFRKVIAEAEKQQAANP
jgi:hypothetical protein